MSQSNQSQSQSRNTPSSGDGSGGLSGNMPTTKGHPRMFDIPFLDDDGSNFAFWKFRVHMVLELCDLWDFVNSTSTKPDPSADAATHAEWTYKDHEARAQITLTLKDEPLNSVLFTSTAKVLRSDFILPRRYIGLHRFLSLFSLHRSPCTIRSGSSRLYDTILSIIRCTISISEPHILRYLVLGDLRSLST